MGIYSICPFHNDIIYASADNRDLSKCLVDVECIIILVFNYMQKDFPLVYSQ